MEGVALSAPARLGVVRASRGPSGCIPTRAPGTAGPPALEQKKGRRARRGSAAAGGCAHTGSCDTGSAWTGIHRPHWRPPGQNEKHPLPRPGGTSPTRSADSSSRRNAAGDGRGGPGTVVGLLPSPAWEAGVRVKLVSERGSCKRAASQRGSPWAHPAPGARHPHSTWWGGGGQAGCHPGPSAPPAAAEGAFGGRRRMTASTVAAASLRCDLRRRFPGERPGTPTRRLWGAERRRIYVPFSLLSPLVSAAALIAAAPPPPRLPARSPPQAHLLPAFPPAGP